MLQHHCSKYIIPERSNPRIRLQEFALCKARTSGSTCNKKQTNSKASECTVQQ